MGCGVALPRHDKYLIMGVPKWRHLCLEMIASFVLAAACSMKNKQHLKWQHHMRPYCCRHLGCRQQRTAVQVAV
jgi:hypothetical protein